jgi:hypothetical protein
MKTPTSKGGQPLPKGAHSSGVPGTAAHRALQGAKRPAPVTIDDRFVASPKGGAPLVIGKGHVEVAGNRSKNAR